MSKKKIICTVTILGLIAGSIGVYNLGTKEDTKTGNMKPAIEKMNTAAVDIQDKKIAETEFIKAVEGLTEEEIVSLKEELKGATNKQARDAIVAKAQDIKVTTNTNKAGSNSSNSVNTQSYSNGQKNASTGQGEKATTSNTNTQASSGNSNKTWDTSGLKETGRYNICETGWQYGVDYEEMNGTDLMGN